MAMATATATSGALRALEDRLRRLLSLGLAAPSSSSSSSPRTGTRMRKVWRISDAEMQGQSVRAIHAFIKARKSKLQSIEKNLLEDIISALEGLLKAESEQVYSVAAEVTATLAKSGGVSLIGSKFQGIYAPLIQLLSCASISTVTFCATALQVIIANTTKLRAGIDVEDLWKAFKDMDILNTLSHRFQTHERFDGEGSSLYGAIADLLATILHFWKEARFPLGRNFNFRKSVLAQCANANEVISSTALRLCAALALCGGVASLLVQDSEALSTCLVTNTNSSRSCNTRTEAFHFLYTLTRSCDLSKLLGETIATSIGKNITNAISEGIQESSSRWSSDIKNLVLKASQAAQGLLRLPGNHHHSFWRSEFGIVTCNLLLDMYDGGNQSHSQRDIVVDTKSGKYDAVLGPVLWDALGWLFINAPTVGEETLLRMKQQVAVISRAIDFACAILSKVVVRKGTQPDLKHLQDRYCTGLEGVLICKVILFLLYSPSHHLAELSKHRLGYYLQQHGRDWLSSFVSKISLTLSSEAAADHMIAVMSLIAASCLSVFVDFREQLLEHGVVDVFVEAIKLHSSTNVSHQTRTSAMKSVYIPIDLNLCCENGPSIWEGSNPMLFFTLWGFANLARGSNTARRINASLRRRLSNPLDWTIMPDEDVDSHLLVLAGSMQVANGVRWCASCCLASCGLFGFPSERSQLSKLFNDIHTSDVHLVFPSGNRVYAHKVIIATKCPDLLPDHKVAPSKEGHPMELNLSARIQEASMEILLEFIYTGLAFVNEEHETDVKLLAKRCHMDNFLRLLVGKMPVWGSVPDIHDFSSAISSKGCSLADIFFEDKDNYQSGCVAAKGDLGHQHAHRAILSAQCSYFEGLFRSGMQDSISKVLKVPLDTESLKWLLQYIYSSVLPRKLMPEAGCMWSSMSKLDQIKHLKSYMELSQVAQQWLLEDLNEQCAMVVLNLLEKNLHLGAEVIKLADVCEQWKLLEGVIQCIARNYPQMRDNGELDVLDEYLIDAVRAAHVRMSMDYRKGIGNDDTPLL